MPEKLAIEHEFVSVQALTARTRVFSTAAGQAPERVQATADDVTLPRPDQHKSFDVDCPRAGPLQRVSIT